MSSRFKQTDYFIENNDYSKITLNNISFVLLNWNIQKKNNTDNWLTDFKKLIEVYNPTIILLQECQFKKGLETLLHIEKFGFVFAPNFIDIFKNSHSGVITASHILHKNATVIKSYAHEPLIKVPKIFLSTTYSIENSNEDLLILNIHAINFVGFWKFISQVQQLENSINCHKGPIILSGDFNTWNKKRFKILNEIITNTNMIKVDFNNNAKHIKKFLLKHTLDHIYYKGLILDSETNVIKTKSSDHNPFIVTFKLSS